MTDQPKFLGADFSPLPDRTHNMHFEVVVATSLDGWIGDPEGNLPFRQREDLKHFKALTHGHVVVMGRKTLESIGKLLPGRLNVILTHQPLLVDAWLGEEGRSEGAPRPLIVSSFEELPRRLAEVIEPEQRVFVIGGASIYEQALEKLDVTHIWRTQIHTLIAIAYQMPGWTSFPAFKDFVSLTSRGPYPADEHNEYQYSFELLARKGVVQR